jgi:hypothetical protein
MFLFCFEGRQSFTIGKLHIIHRSINNYVDSDCYDYLDVHHPDGMLSWHKLFIDSSKNIFQNVSCEFMFSIDQNKSNLNEVFVNMNVLYKRDERLHISEEKYSLWSKCVVYSIDQRTKPKKRVSSWARQSRKVFINSIQSQNNSTTFQSDIRSCFSRAFL